MVRKKPPTESGLGRSTSTPQTIPKLRDLRKAIKADAERKYFQILLIFTNGVTEEACRVAGLSKARFYALRKKYCRSIPAPNPLLPKQD